MAGRLIGNGSANSTTVAPPSANRRTIERRVGSDKAAKTTSNRSGSVTVIVAVAPVDTSQISYLTEWLYIVKDARSVDAAHRSKVPDHGQATIAIASLPRAVTPRLDPQIHFRRPAASPHLPATCHTPAKMTRISAT